MMNVSTFNSYMNDSEKDFNYSYNLSDALEWAELEESFNNWEEDDLDD